ncbi:DUF3343 domain-containing protein [Sporosalibacterium faouarense]|uniref:DUF3343 domain-containing protein n=1 Tax=Sporosalibacterium faouarense TaxID=516123 RepID=UPI00192A7414|nr:DUF3343 domain-containing protein [Sporosalibacterium faouarense]
MQNNLSSKGEYYIAVFNSKNHAVRLNYLLEKKGYRKFKLISTPCSLSNGCSYSLRFNNLTDLEYLKREASDFKQILNSIYEVQRLNGRKAYKRISYLI